jgi:hypothetical protein
MELCPVPVAAKIVKSVMAMAVVLFLGAPGRLVLFCPAGLDELAVSLTGVHDVLECPNELANQEVPPDVGARNGTTNPLDDIRHTREPFQEAFEKVDGILAPDVIAEHDPSLMGAFSESECKRIISVCKPIHID